MNNHTLIECAPGNPVEYLGTLGIFILAYRIDPEVEGRWNEEGFELRSAYSESELLAFLLPVLTDITRWQFIEPTVPENSVYRIGVRLGDNGNFQPFILDWWYDSVRINNDGEYIFKNSSWKLFAGNQNVVQIVRSFIAEIPARFSSLSDLIAFQKKISGRFGFDPLASLSAIDAGYSANNLKMPVFTSIAAELLSLFAIQVFFPPRCGKHARGWQGGDFVYSAWEELLPLPLARVAAVRNPNPRFSSERKTRDKYKNLSPAREITP
jgi:hypothetical protein